MRNATGRITLSWLELLLLALLVIAGLAIWAFVEQRVNLAFSGEPPPDLPWLAKVQQVSTLQRRLINAQDGQSAAQQELTALRAELLSARAALSTTQLTLDLLTFRQPQLLSLPLTGLQSIAPETLQTYTKSLAKSQATATLVAALESGLGDLVKATQELSATLSSLQAGALEYSLAESRLIAMRQQQAATQSRLGAARLQLVEEQATLEALRTAEPRLTSLTPAMFQSLALSPESLPAYAEAVGQRDAAALRLACLSAELPACQARLAAAAGELAVAQDALARSKRFFTAVYSLAYAILLLVAAFLLSLAIPRSSLPVARRGGLLLGALALLLLLYAYQACGALGAAVAGLVLFLPTAAWLLRHHSSPEGNTHG